MGITPTRSTVLAIFLALVPLAPVLAVPVCDDILQGCDESFSVTQGLDATPDGFDSSYFAPSPSAPSLAFSEQSAAFASSSTNLPMPGYIDPATIRSRVRFRYDFARGANFPDRAEYFYPAPNQNSRLTILNGRGINYLDGGPTNEGLNFHELRTYVEWAPGDSNLFSVFGEFSARIVNNYDIFNGSQFDSVRGAGETHGGAGDIVAGLRFCLFEDSNSALTAQVKAYAPTGNPLLGLGTGHTSVEVGLVGQTRLSERFTVCAEMSDWSAIGASRTDLTLVDGTSLTDELFGGNVLRYGLGLGVDLWQPSCDRAVTGFVEFVGWSVLDGFKSNGPGDVYDATGDFIVNAKYGVRWTAGSNSVYVGYGHNLTEERWYSELYRIELSHQF